MFCFPTQWFEMHMVFKQWFQKMSIQTGLYVLNIKLTNMSILQIYKYACIYIYI